MNLEKRTELASYCSNRKSTELFKEENLLESRRRSSRKRYAIAVKPRSSDLGEEFAALIESSLRETDPDKKR